MKKNETLSGKTTSSAKESLPTINDNALLEAVVGGAESVHLYLKSNPNDQQYSTAAETVHLY